MPLPRPLAVFAMLALAAVPALRSTAHAAANHVVISEFATRGPSAATDEFIELYNPTSNPIDIGGWKLQYSSATNGATWSDRAILPAGTLIAPHGFYLIANQTYADPTVADYTSGLWNSGTGMADNGHERIIDAGSVEVDRVGWGTAVNPEGGAPAPNHGTSANGNSVERKALATSTADSLATGGAHAALGNGQDTNVNGSDFVTQTHGRKPQNSSSPPEPAFAAGGNGTGRTTSTTPSVVYTNRAVPTLTIAIRQDSAYTVTNLGLTVPSTWTWSHSPGDVSLTGTAFGSATASVSADSILISGATLTTSDSGSVVIANLTSPAVKGGTTFTVRTAVSGGPLTQIVVQPSVRVLELVPIVSVHVNDAQGVPVSPFGIGAEATVSGIVTANLNDTRTDVYVQDGTGGIDLFNSQLGPITLAPGDSITATGSITQFRGLTEINVDLAMITRFATGRPVPAPLVISCADVNATFHVDGTEPNEGRLVRINGVTYNGTNSTITDASGTCTIFTPFTPGATTFDLVGILKQFKDGTSPPPPYTADYEVTPRTADDIIAHPGPIILGSPYEDQIQSTSVRLNWTTDVTSSSIVYFGTTTALGDSVVDAGSVTTHSLTVPGLSPATVYYYSVGSRNGAGANFSTTDVLVTASPPQTTGQINVYFNKSIDASKAWLHVAHGNDNLTARLVTRLDNAKRSVDAAFYNLSGTSGTAVANALIAAKNRGVKVRVICEYDNLNATFTSISSAGIPLINDRFDPINFGAGLMHDKFAVIDGRGGAPDSAWVFTGSWNPTNPGTDDDYQNSIEFQDQALAVVYTMEFNEMWGSSTDTPNASVSRFGTRKLDDTPHLFSIGGRSVECYFSPSDRVTTHILSFLNSAQHSIGFEVLTLTRSDLAGALIAQKNAGITVRGDLDNGTDTGTEYGNLVSAGVDVKLKTGSGLLHHKYALVDAESPHWAAATLTGSHNWSSSAENSNNENTLIVRDFDVTNQYLQELSARYNQFGGLNPVVVSVEQLDARRPSAVSLSQNFPNPFRGSTSIDYAVSVAQPVSLRLFDVLGREVRTLVNARQAPGHYRVQLAARGLTSGVYFYRLETAGIVLEHKMLFLR